MTAPQYNPTKTLGKRMWMVAWILALVLLTVYFTHREETLLNPNQNPQATTNDGKHIVILKRNINGHYVSSGSINGHPVNFLLDTGATDVVIPSNIAQKIGLIKAKSGYANTANGLITVYDTHLSRLGIGTITLYDVNASINPSMNGRILLGMSALNQIQFSQSGDELTLVQ